jgi:hypothetical protein
MAKKAKTTQEQIEYQLGKLEYHAKRLSKLGIGLNDILPRIDLTPANMPVESFSNRPQPFEQPTIWRYMLFTVWRMEIEDGNDTETTVSTKLGAYGNQYMRVAEKEDRKNIINLFFNELGFEHYEDISVWNNAKYMEVYRATLPIPKAEMQKVIDLLKVRKDAPECQDNRAKARQILNKYYH